MGDGWVTYGNAQGLSEADVWQPYLTTRILVNSGLHGCLETNWSPSLAALNESDIQRKGLGRLHHAALGSATKG